MMGRTYKAYVDSGIGRLEITGEEDGITSVCFAPDNAGGIGCLDGNAQGNAAVGSAGGPDYVPECVRECVMQLEQYFEGTRKEFNIRLKVEGTGFQRKVWKALQAIPYGQTSTYGHIASAVGQMKASRAVGGANNRNKLAIIIPCHRVIGSSGKLTGYAGGLWRKEWLLEHEKKHL